ncbi:flavonol sulfotransferase-like [Dorcoceras hygrometricum]|uniref:Flavonol sulfotransferase-like n=1 Tax=Dorcoceras hygrometricum TaxID=472368 RepID=A0A2Z7AC73_9LAMI|nr:flavonol sulfotransferase-like [Dorcoceras hygrometricum]
MQHAIINAMKCMRAIKGRIARPVNQLENHLNRASIPRTVYQPGKSSVRDLQSPSAHHSSVVFRHNQSVGHHSDDSIGLFRHDTSVGQSQRGSQSGQNTKLKQFNKLSHVNHRITSADLITSITAMSTLKAVKSAQFVPSTADFYLNRFTKAGHKQLKQVCFLVLRQSRQDAPRASNPEAETSGRTIYFHCTKKPATAGSSQRSLYSLNWVTIGRQLTRKSSATKITQNHGGERRKSTGK